MTPEEREAMRQALDLRRIRRHLGHVRLQVWWRPGLDRLSVRADLRADGTRVWSVALQRKDEEGNREPLLETAARAIARLAREVAGRREWA